VKQTQKSCGLPGLDSSHQRLLWKQLQIAVWRAVTSESAYECIAVFTVVFFTFFQFACKVEVSN